MNHTLDALQDLWRTLNLRYFDGALSPIPIVWSRRLTSSAGLFITREGPRPRRGNSEPGGERRLIRLSVPLLQRPEVSPQDVRLTLAHEMIHQWQFDVLKRRPNHGPDFRRKMSELNRDGVDITIRHRMDGPVRALAKYRWRCQRCGHAYERHRRTINPRRHRCGRCRGVLQELIAPIHLSVAKDSREQLPADVLTRLTRLNRSGMLGRPSQLSLPFTGS